MEKKTKEEFYENLRKIRFVVMDFDGVLTDNKVLHFADGREAIVRSRADSLAVDLLQEAGLYNKKNYEDNTHEVDLMILSRETNYIVNRVADKMKIKSLNGRFDKYDEFKKQIELRKLDNGQVLFVGNDVNDLECICSAGIGVAVADSYLSILEAANYITEKSGGNGVLREICDLILESRRKQDDS